MFLRLSRASGRRGHGRPFFFLLVLLALLLPLFQLALTGPVSAQLQEKGCCGSSLPNVLPSDLVKMQVGQLAFRRFCHDCDVRYKGEIWLLAVYTAVGVDFQSGMSQSGMSQ